MNTRVLLISLVTLCFSIPAFAVGNTRANSSIDASGVTPNDVSPSGMSGAQRLTNANRDAVLNGGMTGWLDLNQRSIRFKYENGQLYVQGYSIYSGIHPWRSTSLVAQGSSATGAVYATGLSAAGVQVVQAGGPYGCGSYGCAGVSPDRLIFLPWVH